MFLLCFFSDIAYSHYSFDSLDVAGTEFLPYTRRRYFVGAPERLQQLEQQWVLNLTDNQALQKAGVFSKSYWLRHF